MHVDWIVLVDGDDDDDCHLIAGLTRLLLVGHWGPKTCLNFQSIGRHLRYHDIWVVWVGECTLLD